MTNPSARDRLRDTLREAWRLHALLRELRREGLGKQQLLDELTTLRAQELSEEEEEVLLEGMDFLTGFCGPDARID